SSESTAATRAMESRKASSGAPSAPAASWVATNSSEAATSSSMFSSRASASAVRSALSASRYPAAPAQAPDQAAEFIERAPSLGREVGGQLAAGGQQRDAARPGRVRQAI